ncbi:30S ribosomal protein THX [Xylella taiwanensis]|uniref:30S ribosomal protein THX n=1 Tax=Xylella taiwanensis TaxID=1444770 RepID=Z9JM20_9GAMM|nr:30S ribosomal protein THX [Xylella taiwanensis]EWS78881.1 SSU ribosomal protein S31P [Xylella taiwanensis]MCD8457282.1 30S ribosomal protein THX [Xylella taiwanensis]MCD8459692.1 30S ribosomal protein THX [Xylella taiwanensis]MCD8461439.1 30S ribosomal protein THX [Xylella taiwanensis]MCD8462532.1 30S ribosomal protein THX [Xylella taiwanensis]
MGKGDRKTTKGKRYNASYGNSRPHSTSRVSVDTAASVSDKRLSKTPSPKAVIKKTVAKVS